MAEYQVVLSSRAGRDIRVIECHTRKSWGQDQASTYVESNWQTIESITTFPEIGRVVAVGPPSTRGIGVGRHIIFYRIGDSMIEISRIVHERRDAAWLLE
jgi:toxin ParE1/3/4